MRAYIGNKEIKSCYSGRVFCRRRNGAHLENLTNEEIHDEWIIKE
jgi:hypothetical protein